MKKILIGFIISLLALFLSACVEGESNSSQPEASQTISNTQSVSYSASENEAGSEFVSESVTESTVAPEEVYPYLKSDYSVTSQSVAHGNTYICDYFFIDGLVAGARFSTTFSDTEAANDFYEHIADDYPDAVIENTTITFYDPDDDKNYYGYTLEKLKFILEKTKLEYTVNFDEEEFYSEFFDTSER